MLVVEYAATPSATKFIQIKMVGLNMNLSTILILFMILQLPLPDTIIIMQVVLEALTLHALLAWIKSIKVLQTCTLITKDAQD